MEQIVLVEDVNQPMYNLTVDEAHTFAVGDGEWVVHNCDLRPSSNPQAFSQYTDRNGLGFGQLVGMQGDATESGFQEVINHLTNSPYLDSGALNTPENQVMINRLRNALDNGTPISGADLSFYLHETTEYDIGLQLMNRNPAVSEIFTELPGVDRYGDIPNSVHSVALNQLQASNPELWIQVVYQYSHQSALGKFGVSQFSVYTLEAAQAGGLSRPFIDFWR